MYKNLPQTLPVAGIQKETKRYIVQRDDRPYYVKQLPFQYDKEAPETLACIVRLDEQTNEIIEIIHLQSRPTAWLRATITR